MLGGSFHWQALWQCAVGALEELRLNSHLKVRLVCDFFERQSPRDEAAKHVWPLLCAGRETGLDNRLRVAVDRAQGCLSVTILLEHGLCILRRRHTHPVKLPNPSLSPGVGCNKLMGHCCMSHGRPGTTLMVVMMGKKSSKSRR